MALISGFQANSTVHCCLWVYKPDPTLDPISEEQFIEVNSLQYIKCTPQQILASITNVTLTSNILTLTVTFQSSVIPSSLRAGQQQVLFSGLTNATFLNRSIATIASINGNQITFNYPHADYSSTAEPAGAQISDATGRKLWLYYPETNVSTSQHPRELIGPAAALFIYDLEVLFQ